MLFRLPLRQTDGFVGSLLRLMELDITSPDHTTLSRRAKQFAVDLRTFGEKTEIHLIVDSTGLQFRGQGPWASAKHGKKGMREWRKLHLAVDQNAVILAEKLTNSSIDDASVVPDLLVVVPPVKTATPSKFRTRAARARNRTVNRVRKVGRRKWKKEVHYHRQARVENTFFRYKQLFGGRLRAHDSDNQEAEARLACSILNRMLELGPPRFEANRS